MSASRALFAHVAPLWPRVLRHPFLAAASTGDLSPGAFQRWIVNDYHFGVGYQRFVGGLMTIAPTAYATEVVTSGLVVNMLGYDRLKQAAAQHGIDLETEPAPTTLGFTAFLQALLNRGWEVAIAALYASDRVYVDAWTSVRDGAERNSDYWPLIDAWSDEDFNAWIDELGGLVDATCPELPGREVKLVFERVVRFELQYWTALYAGETW